MTSGDYKFLTRAAARVSTGLARTEQVGRRRLTKLFHAGHLDRFRRSRAPAARSRGPTSSARKVTACFARSASSSARARFEPPDGLRLPLRPPRGPPQRVGARVAPACSGPRSLAWDGETEYRSADRSAPTPRCASMTTAASKGCATRGRGSSGPTRCSRSRAAPSKAPARSSSSTTAPRRVDKNFEKFLRYDGLLCWWWRHTWLAARPRSPFVIFVCQDDGQRDTFLEVADRELTGHLWHPSDGAGGHEYVGRDHILFATEVDMHRWRARRVARTAVPVRQSRTPRRWRPARCRSSWRGDPRARPPCKARRVIRGTHRDQAGPCPSKRPTKSLVFRFRPLV